MKLLRTYDEKIKLNNAEVVDVRVIEECNCIEIEVENGEYYKVVFEQNVFLKTVKNIYNQIMNWLNNGDGDLVLRRKVRKVRKHNG